MAGSKARVYSIPMHGYSMSFGTWWRRKQGGVCLDNCLMQLLMFADDTVLLAEVEEDLQHNVREFSEAVKQHRLAISTEKNNQNRF